MLSKPLPPALAPAPRLPWVSLIAPIVIAGLFSVIWASPYALLIGVLAPTLALGHWIESRRRHRIAAEDSDASYQRALNEWERSVADEQRSIVQRGLEASPHPEQWRDHPLWRPVVVDGVRQIRVGLTSESGPGGPTVTGIPALVGIDRGVAVVGSGDVAHGLWRVVVLGICSHLARSQPAIHPDTVWGESDSPRDVILVGDDSGHEIHALRVDDVSDVPPQVSVVLIAEKHSARWVVDGVASHTPLRPDSISVAASRWVLNDSSKRIPRAHEITQRAPDPDDRSALLLRLSSKNWVDLVADGPHALIWGQTGSGKSVLIRQFIHSIAGFYRPDQVSVVVIDFKGGMGTSATAHYPHVVGVLSDLTPLSVSRVEEGIKAEIRHRERILADARVDSVSDLDVGNTLPRILIIADEVATLIEQHPQWEQLLSDIASRGRALGLHLICASQRIAGQIPRTVLVNSPLRICFRVSDAHEARDFLPGVPHQVLGRLLYAPAGSALVLDASGTHREISVEEETPNQLLSGSATSLWCEPLAPVIEAAPPGLAVLDRPCRQDQPLLYADDVAPGLLWVSGDSGRGLTSVLARWVEVGDDHLVLPGEAAGLIDTVRQLREGSLAPPTLILVEHLDRLLESVPSATIQWCGDALAAIARIQRKAHFTPHLVVGSAPRGEVASLLARSAESTWRLVPTRRDRWRDYGLPDQLFDADAPPGRLLIDGVLAQSVCARSSLADSKWREDGSDPEVALELVVSGRPHDMTAQPEGVLVIAADECDRNLPLIDRAYRRGALGVHAVGTPELAPFMRHHPPLPDPGQSRIWQVGANSWRLRKLLG